MTSTVQTRMVAFGGVLLLLLAVFVLAVASAQAAPTLTQLQRAHGSSDVTYAAAPLTQLQRAHGGANVAYAAAGPASSVAGVGRFGGRGFVRTTPVAASTAALVGGSAVATLVAVLIAFLALGGRASRRGELAPVTSIVQAPSGSPATQYEDRERKAA
ncbi:MAG: hypothetical protein WCP98_19490 [Actinomycetes bacterium]